MKKCFLSVLLTVMILVLFACSSDDAEKPSDSDDAKITVTAVPTEDIPLPPTPEATGEVTPEITPESTPTEEPSKERVITLWSTATIGDTSREAYEKAIADMKARYPEVTLNWEAIDYGDYSTKLLNAMWTDSLPDIFFSPADNIFDAFVQGGGVYCLDEVYPLYADKLPKKMCKNMTYYGGQLYGIPLSMNMYCLYANADVLSAVGYDSIPATYEGLLECCEALKAEGYIPFGMVCPFEWDYMNLGAFFASFIEKTCGAETVERLLNGDEDWYNGDVAGAVDQIRKMMQNGYFDSTILARDGDDVRSDFIEGKFAFLMDGTWYCGVFAERGNFLVSEIPVINPDKGKQGQGISAQSNMLAVSAKCKDAEEVSKYAFELAELICKYEYLDGIGIPTWTVDYEDQQMGLPAREMAKYVADSDDLVLFDLNAIDADTAIAFCEECVRMLKDENLDGTQFVNDLNDPDIPDEPLVPFSPSGESS